jgi:hypothetical protein
MKCSKFLHFKAYQNWDFLSGDPGDEIICSPKLVIKKPYHLAGFDVATHCSRLFDGSQRRYH